MSITASFQGYYNGETKEGKQAIRYNIFELYQSGCMTEENYEKFAEFFYC
jgi:hypothetical protein